MTDENRWLIVGLGNPGPTYAGTRHNVGYLVLDVLADRIGGRFRSHKGRADVASGRLAGVPVVLAKSRSYMNESGGPVSSVANYYSVAVSEIAVIHDELDLPYGVLRVKRGGGDNGHNGLRSITRSLGSKEYARVRVGIDRPPGRQDPVDYVLRDFSSVQRKDLSVHLERAADAVESLITQGLPETQNAFNR